MTENDISFAAGIFVGVLAYDSYINLRRLFTSRQDQINELKCARHLRHSSEQRTDAEHELDHGTRGIMNVGLEHEEWSKSNDRETK